MDVLSTTLLIFMGMIFPFYFDEGTMFPYFLRKGGKAVEYDARSETRLSIETSPVARTNREASGPVKKVEIRPNDAYSEALFASSSLALSSPPPPLFQSEEEGQSQCFGIHFSPEDPLVVVDVGYGAEGRILIHQRGGGQIEDISNDHH